MEKTKVTSKEEGNIYYNNTSEKVIKYFKKRANKIIDNQFRKQFGKSFDYYIKIWETPIE